MHHLNRLNQEITLCHLERTQVQSSLTIDEAKLPRRHDVIGDAVARAGGLSNVCPECLSFRVLPWDSTHGQTETDTLHDDDEYWKDVFTAANTKMVD